MTAQELSNKKITMSTLKSFIKKSDELFRIELIKNEFNIRQTLIKLELTPKGGNYKRAHRLISEIKSYNNLK
jgi:hypothetical protein